MHVTDDRLMWPKLPRSEDPRNIVVRAASQSASWSDYLQLMGVPAQPIPMETSDSYDMMQRELGVLAQDPGYRDRIIFVAGSDSWQYVNDSFVFADLPGGGDGVPHQVAAPYSGIVLAEPPQGIVQTGGTSIGAPMVAGLALQLYTMKADLTGAEVVDLIMDGAAIDEAFFGDMVSAASVANLPADAPTIYQLDAYGSLQLLSSRYPGSPICGLDVFVRSEGDVLLMRDEPEVLAVAPSNEFSVAVAPGGRTLAVGNISSTFPLQFTTHFYDVGGALLADSVGVISYQYLKDGSAAHVRLPDTLMIGGAAVHLAGQGGTAIAPNIEALSGVTVSPDASRAAYVTRSETPDSTITQVRMISNLGTTNDAVTLVEDRDDKAALPDAQLMGTSWSDFGDLILVTRYLDQASPPFNPTQYLVVDPDVGPASVSPLVTVDEGFAWGRMWGDEYFKAAPPPPGSSACTIYLRSIASGALVASADVSGDVPECGWWHGNYGPALTRRKVAGDG